MHDHTYFPVQNGADCDQVRRHDVEPTLDPAASQKILMKRLSRTKKLFAFLREQRHRLFDDAFQVDLEGMYRQSGAGVPPHPPR